MTAYELTFTYQAPLFQATSVQAVIAVAMPSMPAGTPRPDDAIEVVRPGTSPALDQVLYRRPFARLGHAEAYGADSEWAPLASTHRQVLASIVPDFEAPQQVVVYAGGVERFRMSLPPPPLPPPPPPPGGIGIVEGLVPLHGHVQLYDQRFNLVLVAEGYRAGDRAMFEGDVAAVVDRLRAAAPFAAHPGAFNVFRLDVWSVEPGASRGAASVNTYFRAQFPGTFAGSSAPPQLLLVDEDLVLATVEQQLAQTFKKKVCLPHKIIVMVNTEYHGGSGGAGDGIAVASRAHGPAVTARTVLHELGHAFGLIDEYPAGGGWAPNLAHASDRDRLPWEDLVPASASLPSMGGAGSGISFATVGAFADPDLPGWYRPQWLCRMRYSRHDAFCKVCARYIERALQSVP